MFFMLRNGVTIWYHGHRHGNQRGLEPGNSPCVSSFPCSTTGEFTGNFTVINVINTNYLMIFYGEFFTWDQRRTFSSICFDGYYHVLSNYKHHQLMIKTVTKQMWLTMGRMLCAINHNFAWKCHWRWGWKHPIFGAGGACRGPFGVWKQQEFRSYWGFPT